MTIKEELLSPQKNHCAYCHKELHGREGKIYCNVDCKNNFNAQIRSAKRAQETNVFPETIAKLKNNYRILARYKLNELDENQSIDIRIEEIRNQGFDLRFCTGADYNHKSGLQKYCFDYAWIKQGSFLKLFYAPNLAARW